MKMTLAQAMTTYACIARSGDTPETEALKDLLAKGAKEIEHLEAEIVTLTKLTAQQRKILSQCRLAFAGYVSSSSAVDAIDKLGGAG